jgi:hypothetical protein
LNFTIFSWWSGSLLVVVRIVVGQDSAAEHQPLGEAVEGLHPVGDAGDALAKFRLAEILTRNCQGDQGG